MGFGLREGGSTEKLRKPPGAVLETEDKVGSKLSVTKTPSMPSVF